MTTAVYSNRQNIGSEGILSTLSPINVRIESDARPEEISSFLISLAASIKETAKPRQETLARPRFETTAHAYYCNKYGDEYACCDELGFESSYMGARADHNHIF